SEVVLPALHQALRMGALLDEDLRQDLGSGERVRQDDAEHREHLSAVARRLEARAGHEGLAEGALLFLDRLIQRAQRVVRGGLLARAATREDLPRRRRDEAIGEEVQDGRAGQLEIGLRFYHARERRGLVDAEVDEQLVAALADDAQRRMDE